MLNSSEPAKLIAQRFAPYSISDSSPEFPKPSLNARIAALPWRATKRGEKIMLSLSEAAIAAGGAQTPLLGAGKAGRNLAHPNGTPTYQGVPTQPFSAFSPNAEKNEKEKHPPDLPHH